VLQDSGFSTALAEAGLDQARGDRVDPDVELGPLLAMTLVAMITAALLMEYTGRRSGLIPAMERG